MPFCLVSDGTSERLKESKLKRNFYCLKTIMAPFLLEILKVDTMIILYLVSLTNCMLIFSTNNGNAF